MVRPGRLMVWLVATLSTAGIQADFSHSGYLKNQTAGSRSLVNGDPYLSNLTRLRLKPRYREGDWTIEAAYDLELLTGNFLDSSEFALLNGAPDPRYWTLQDEFYESGDLVARHQLYRGTVQWRSPMGDFRLGRQQVNWSTALIWNPMDILNPVSPLQLEPDERIGVDAILWDQAWGALGRISAVHAPQHDDDDASTAARVKRYIAGVDAGLMAGEFEDVMKLGFDGSGSVMETGWRTEWVWSDPDVSDSYWQGVVDLNWSFRNGLTLALEYFYNGRPVPVSAIGPETLVSAQPIYAGRHYTGLLMRHDINPFWQYEVVALRNADDASWVVYPRSRWIPPLSQEIYLTVGAQWFGGGDSSEYGRLKALMFLEAQWYF